MNKILFWWIIKISPKTGLYNLIIIWRQNNSIIKFWQIAKTIINIINIIDRNFLDNIIYIRILKINIIIGEFKNQLYNKIKKCRNNKKLFIIITIYLLNNSFYSFTIFSLFCQAYFWLSVIFYHKNMKSRSLYLFQLIKNITW